MPYRLLWSTSFFGGQVLIFSALDSNLMAPDEFKNLGFAEDQRIDPVPNNAGGATAHKVRDDGKKIS